MKSDSVPFDEWIRRWTTIVRTDRERLLILTHVQQFLDRLRHKQLRRGTAPVYSPVAADRQAIDELELAYQLVGWKPSGYAQLLLALREGSVTALDVSRLVHSDMITRRALRIQAVRQRRLDERYMTGNP